MVGTFTQCECESQWSSRTPGQSPCTLVLSCTDVQNKVPCVKSAVTAFLKSSHQTLKSFSKRRKCERKLCEWFMSNVQITKWRKNATTDKLNVNLSLIPEEVSLIFRWLEVIHSLSPPLPRMISNDWCEVSLIFRWLEVIHSLSLSPPPDDFKRLVRS